jgi:hypothetical protein
VPERVLAGRVVSLRRFGPRFAEWSDWVMESSQNLWDARRDTWRLVTPPNSEKRPTFPGLLLNLYRNCSGPIEWRQM